jgi:LacI family transcriptional regulator
MKDIASQLGVSVALVSYVLNGKKTNKISAQTAARIKALAAQMNYSPNQIAKSLKTNRTYTLGLIVADISNLFYSSIAKYIEEQANANGYHVIYASAHEDPDRFGAILNLLLSRQVDGFILALPENGERWIELLEDQHRPYVIIDRKSACYPDAPSILLDNRDASEQIVTHLVANGYKRPGLVTINRNLLHLEERKLGYADTCKSLLGVEPYVYELEEGRLEEQMQEIIQQAVYTDRVDSLCFFTNKVAMAGLSEIATINMAVPEQLGIVCFDEAAAYKLFRTSITYLKQPIEAMSKAAVEYLVTLLDSKDEKPEKGSRQFKGSLIVNNSSVKKSTPQC